MENQENLKQGIPQNFNYITKRQTEAIDLIFALYF